MPTADLTSEAPVWEVREDATQGTTTVLVEHARTLCLPDGTEITERQSMRSKASRHDPAKASAEGETRVRRTHLGIATEANAVATLRSSTTTLHFVLTLNVLVDGQSCFERRWEVSFPRLLL